MRNKKSHILSALVAVSALLCLSWILIPKSTGNDRNDVEAAPDYNAIISRFNEEHSTNYKIATDGDVSNIGVTPEERDSFINNMSESEFIDYLTDIYNSDPLYNTEKANIDTRNNTNNTITNTPHFESDEEETFVVSAKIIDGHDDHKLRAEFVNE